MPVKPSTGLGEALHEALPGGTLADAYDLDIAAKASLKPLIAMGERADATSPSATPGADRPLRWINAHARAQRTVLSLLTTTSMIRCLT